MIKLHKGDILIALDNWCTFSAIDGAYYYFKKGDKYKMRGVYSELVEPNLI